MFLQPGVMMGYCTFGLTECSKPFKPVGGRAHGLARADPAAGDAAAGPWRGRARACCP